MRTLYIMSGIPGSGKTYYTENNAIIGDFILHRDEFRQRIRERLNTDKYFPVPSAQEYDEWSAYIREILTNFPYDDVYIDQTTLTASAAYKLLANIMSAVDCNTTNITFVICHISLPTALRRNAERTGAARVPERVIRNMAASMKREPITLDFLRTHFPAYNFTITNILTLEN